MSEFQEKAKKMMLKINKGKEGLRMAMTAVIIANKIEIAAPFL